MFVHNTIISSFAKSVFPSPIIRTMPLKSNLKELASYKASAPKENRAMIEHLIELYSNKKILNFKTVENAVARLASHTKSKPTQTKAVREYDKIAKHVQGRSTDHRPHPAANLREAKEGVEQGPKHNPNPF